jgi:hypothetical protein
MKIIPPLEITDATFASSSLGEPSAAELADADYRGIWNDITTYMVNAFVIYTPEHKKYQSLQNTNLNRIPGVDGSETWWLDIGASDEWKVFDSKVGSQATFTSVITYDIRPGVTFDSIAILNIEAETVVVTVEDEGGTGATTVWTEIVYADGMFTPDIAKTDFPTDYLTPHVTVELTYTGETVKVGEIVIGTAQSLGNTKYVPSVGIIDYSMKQIDTFGNYTILERAYSKRLSCATNVLNTELDTVYNILAENRATPVVWVGYEEYASMIVFGFYKDFSIEIPYLKYSVCTLEIEGLV